MRLSVKSKCQDFASLERVPWLQVRCPADPPAAAVKTLWAGLGVYPKPAPQEVKEAPQTPKQAPPGATRAAVAHYVQEAGKVTATQIALHFNADKKQIRNALGWLVSAGYVLGTRELVRGKVRASVFTRTNKYLVERKPKTDAILVYLKAHPGATAKEIAAGLEGVKLSGLLGNLRRKGSITSAGTFSKTQYWLAEPEESY